MLSRWACRGCGARFRISLAGWLAVRHRQVCFALLSRIGTHEGSVGLSRRLRCTLIAPGGPLSQH